MSGPTRGGEKGGAARPSFNVGMQRSMAIALVLGGLAFLLVAILAAWLVANPIGRYTPRSVAPVLDEYLQAAERMDIGRASRLLSSNGLRRTAQQDLRSVFSLRDLYDSYAELEIHSVERIESEEAVALDTALVRGEVRDAFGRRAQLVAQLEYESGRWRILSVRVWRRRSGGP